MPDKKFFVVTGTSILEKPEVSWKFACVDPALRGLLTRYAYVYAYMHLRKKGENEIVNAFKAVRGEPGGIGDDGVKRLEIFVFQGGDKPKGNLITWAVENFPEKDADKALKEFIQEELPSCILLMHCDLYPRFETACKEAGASVNAYHHDGELPTS